MIEKIYCPKCKNVFVDGAHPQTTHCEYNINDSAPPIRESTLLKKWMMDSRATIDKYNDLILRQEANIQLYQSRLNELGVNDVETTKVVT